MDREQIEKLAREADEHMRRYCETNWYAPEEQQEICDEHLRERDEALVALRNLTTRTEEFWAFLRGEHGIRLSAEDGDDHNVVEFFIAMDRARALLARVEEGKR